MEDCWFSCHTLQWLPSSCQNSCNIPTVNHRSHLSPWVVCASIWQDCRTGCMLCCSHDMSFALPSVTCHSWLCFWHWLSLCGDSSVQMTFAVSPRGTVPTKFLLPSLGPWSLCFSFSDALMLPSSSILAVSVSSHCDHSCVAPNLTIHELWFQQDLSNDQFSNRAIHNSARTPGFQSFSEICVILSALIWNPTTAQFNELQILTLSCFITSTHLHHGRLEEWRLFSDLLCLLSCERYWRWVSKISNGG